MAKPLSGERGFCFPHTLCDILYGMNKLSRRQFLRAAAALTVSGALAWKPDIADASPPVGVDKVVEGGGSIDRILDIEAPNIYDDDGLIILDDDDVLQEQPFAPYCLDPDSGMWKALFAMPMPRGMLDVREG